jgi:uncharacterized protein YbjT (DUF2867 family)
VELVVGATGQVGAAVVAELSARGTPVRAFVRPDADTSFLRDLPHVELAVGDLLEPDTVRAAVAGCEHIIATANGVSPRHRRDHRAVERVGYPTLIDEAVAAGVDRFVYLSQPMPPHEDLPMQRDKKVAEEYLRRSGLEYAIVRPAAFMESWLAFAGSRLPLRGEVAPTVRRDFWLMKVSGRFTGSTIDDRGVMMVNGGPDARYSFISARDVASILIAATTHPRACNADLEVGGPEALSWREVAEIYSQVLGREVTIKTNPAWVFRTAAAILTPFSPAAANLMALNVNAAEDMIISDAVAHALGSSGWPRCCGWRRSSRRRPPSHPPADHRLRRSTSCGRLHGSPLRRTRGPARPAARRADARQAHA